MDNAIGLGIILSLQDRASSGLENIRNRMTALRDVSQEMMKKFDEGAKQMVTGFASMAAGAKVLGVLNSTFGASVTTAADFEQAMARVGAVSGATGEDFERLAKQARDLGRDTQYSASQAAASQESLARAGFKTNEIIDAMPGLLNMAAAEGMDLASAADIASSAIRGFGLDASEANRVADVLAKTSSASNTSIALLGESLKYVAPIAKGLGFSIEQTNAMLGVMANAGIKGSQAGTSLKSAFQRLSEEPKRVAKALGELGVKAKTANGDLRPLPELMVDIAKKTQGMGKADKLGILSRIFGGVASSGMLAVMDGVANGSLPELEDALYHCSGAAKEMADRMNATAQGAMKRLESASEGLRIVIGNHLLPVYTWIIDKMAQFKSWLTQLIEAHPVISKAVIGFTAALLGLSGVTLILVGALASVGGFIKMWPLLKVMAVSALSSIRAQAHFAMTSLSGLGAPVIAMIALAGALYFAWRKNLWGFRDMVTAITEGFNMAFSASTDGIAEVDEELANKLKAAGIWDFAVTMGQVFFRVRQFWEGFVEGFEEGLNFIKAAFDWLKDLFAPAVESGQELLRFLGILKPITETQSSTWKSWGQAIGRIAPTVLILIAAFKGFSIVVGIFKAITVAAKAWTAAQWLLNVALNANPIGLVVVAVMALITAGYLLYQNWDNIVQWWSESWTLIKNNVEEFRDWLANSPLSNWLKDYLGLDLAGAWEGILSYIEGVGQFWSGIADTIHGIFTLDLDEIWSGLSQIGEGFISAFTGIWDTVLGLFGTSVSEIWESCEEVISGIYDSFMGIFDIDFSSIWEDLKAWWDSWTLSDIFAPVNEYASNAWSYVTQKWQNFRAWWNSWSFSDIFTSVKGYASKAWSYVSQKWQNFRTWWDSWSFADVFASVREYAGVAKDYVAEKWASLKSWWDSWSFPDIFAPVKEYASEAWSYVSQKWQEFGAWWDSWSLKDIFPESFSFSWDDVASGLESVKGIISSGWQSLTESLSFDGLPSVWEGLTSGFESAKGLLLSGWNNLAGMLTIDFSGFWDTLASGFSTVCDTIKSAWNGVTGFIKDKWNTASDYVSGAWNWTKGLFGYGEDTDAAQQKQLQAQVQDITVLNKMSEGFTQRVSEMTTAWQPFKASLGEGFEQIYTVMQSIADKINSTVIPAVNSLVSALGGVARELVSVSQAGNLDIKVGAVSQPASGVVPAQPPRMSGGRNKSSVPAYAAGGIITQPHIGLVGEAGREAIIPLEDRNSGIPLLMSAISELGVSSNEILPYLNPIVPEIEAPSMNLSAPTQIAHSTPLLIQHSQNQAVMNGQAQVKAQEQSPERPLNVNNHVDVVIEGKPVELYIGEEKVGSVVLKWVERQNIRNGMGAQ